MNRLSAPKSKRQFYRILHHAAEEAVFKIETANSTNKKRKIDTFLENQKETTNANISFKHSQTSDINTEKHIAHKSIVNADSFSVETDQDTTNSKTDNVCEQNEQIYSKTLKSFVDSVNYNNDELIDKFSIINYLSYADNVQTSNEFINERVHDYKCNEDINDYLEHNLKIWAVENNISRTSFQKLLKILNKVHPNLRSDPRTIFGNLNNVSVEVMGNGQYYNFNLKNMLKEQLKMRKPPLLLLPIIWLKFNIDGLPLFKSSRIQLWAILGLIKELNLPPFVCAVYCGKEKPDLKLFLKDFVPELKDLLANGIIINDIKYTIFVKSFIFDAPGRAFLKGIKGHGGYYGCYYGCEKCVQKGQWKKTRVIFPEYLSTLRTDISFAERKQKKHHKEISPLVDIGINMITMFPLDPMHLVYLGVMRKLFA